MPVHKVLGIVYEWTKFVTYHVLRDSVISYVGLAEWYCGICLHMGLESYPPYHHIPDGCSFAFGYNASGHFLQAIAWLMCWLTACDKSTLKPTYTGRQLHFEYLTLQADDMIVPYTVYAWLCVPFSVCMTACVYTMYITCPFLWKFDAVCYILLLNDSIWCCRFCNSDVYNWLHPCSRAHKYG